jgi:hypothetical protein
VARGQRLPPGHPSECETAALTQGVLHGCTAKDFICILPPNIKEKHKQQRMDRHRVTHMLKCPKKAMQHKIHRNHNAYIIFFDPNSYFSSVVEAGGFQKDWEK